MKLNLPDAVTSRIGHQTLVLQKHSPQILFFGGLALMGATVVAACKGTLRLEGVLDEIKEDREIVRTAALDNPEKYDDKQVAKLNAFVTAKGIAKVAKLYLPSIALGVAAVACLTSSHTQLTRRNAGLSAALAATERALDRYRDRVREHLGEEKELQIWRDEREHKEPILDDEGRETKSKKTVKTGGGYSQYARLWGRDTSSEWDPDAQYNLPKLKSVQEWATRRLNAKGHLFLNEVFDELGLARTTAGAVVGWKSEKYGGEDGFVDFGVIARNDEDQLRFHDFATGLEDAIWLDFNVDGDIHRDLDKDIINE